MEYHDKEEWYGPSNTPFFAARPKEDFSVRALLGLHATQMCAGAFPDRHICILGLGEKGSGKSVVCQTFLNVYPPYFQFVPSYDEPKALQKMRPHHLIADMNDMRLSTNFNRSVLLNWWEGKQIEVGVKNEASVRIRSPPAVIASTNYVRPEAGFRQEDIDAPLDRCKVFTWAKPLPSEIKKTLKACRRCSADALAYCMLAPPIQEVLRMDEKVARLVGRANDPGLPGSPPRQRRSPKVPKANLTPRDPATPPVAAYDSIFADSHSFNDLVDFAELHYEEESPFPDFQ